MNALIIEDDPSFAERMRCSVERLGETWQAILFRTAGEALDYLDNPSHRSTSASSTSDCRTKAVSR